MLRQWGSSTSVIQCHHTAESSRRCEAAYGTTNWYLVYPTPPMGQRLATFGARTMWGVGESVLVRRAAGPCLNIDTTFGGPPAAPCTQGMATNTPPLTRLSLCVGRGQWTTFFLDRKVGTISGFNRKVVTISGFNRKVVTIQKSGLN